MWTGRSAKALRLALRKTGEEFAQHLGLAPRAIAKWESSPDLVQTLSTQQLLDVVLAKAADDDKARFALLLQEQVVPDLTHTSASSEREPSSLAISTPPSTAFGEQATPDLLEYLRDSLHNHYTTDNRLGPRILLPVITAHLDSIEQLRQNTSGRTLDELLRIGAAYSEFAGWLCHDSGRLEDASRWCRQSLEFAHAAGDDRMAAFVFTRRAAQAISRRDGEYAARVASAARRYSGDGTAHVRAIALLTEAHGYSMCRSPGKVDEAIGLAEVLITKFGTAATGDDPTLGRYCELDLYLQISRAKCSLELGRAADAVAQFTQVIKDLPPEYHRDRGQYLAHLGRAYDMAGEPDSACAVASDALEIALATGSSRTIAELRRSLASRLKRWPNLSTALDLQHRLKHIESANGGQ